MPKQKPNEQVQQIPLSEIRPFKNHPFKVTDDELMQQTIDSIMQVGVLNPPSSAPHRRADTRWYPDTGGSMPQTLRG